MTVEQANAVLKFLRRVDLKGAEVPEFNQVVASIAASVTPPPNAAPAPASSDGYEPSPRDLA